MEAKSVGDSFMRNQINSHLTADGLGDTTHAPPDKTHQGHILPRVLLTKKHNLNLIMRSIRKT